MLTRLVDFLKMQQITAMFTHLSSLVGRLESTDEAISSIMDSWLLLRDVEHKGRRSCALYVLKSRGMAHSHEMREFLLTDDGIHLGGIYTDKLDSADKQATAKRDKRATAKRVAVKGAASGKGGKVGRKKR
jgi:circadian clock protein KaiC